MAEKTAIFFTLLKFSFIKQEFQFFCRTIKDAEWKLLQQTSDSVISEKNAKQTVLEKCLFLHLCYRIPTSISLHNLTLK